MENTMFSLLTEKLISPLVREEEIRSSFRLDREIIKVPFSIDDCHRPDEA